MSKAAVFFDRDGTLNVEKGYVHRIEDWEWIPGAIDAIAKLRNAGFLIVVITNQAGIARGYYNEEDMNTLHSMINTQLKFSSSQIDKFYHCPHHPKFGSNRKCTCRKPFTGMIDRARIELDIDIEKSWLIGDKLSDIQAGLNAGIKSIHVLTGYGKGERSSMPSEVICLADITDAKNYIIENIDSSIFEK